MIITDEYNKLHHYYLLNEPDLIEIPAKYAKSTIKSGHHTVGLS